MNKPLVGSVVVTIDLDRGRRALQSVQAAEKHLERVLHCLEMAESVVPKLVALIDALERHAPPESDEARAARELLWNLALRPVEEVK